MDCSAGAFDVAFGTASGAVAPLLGELQELANHMADFRLVPTMTQVRDSDRWNGQTARIDAAFLKRAAGDLAGSVCYVAGPNELAYLAQLREVYAAFGIPMPLMQQRLS